MERRHDGASPGLHPIPALLENASGRGQDQHARPATLRRLSWGRTRPRATGSLPRAREPFPVAAADGVGVRRRRLLLLLRGGPCRRGPEGPPGWGCAVLWLPFQMSCKSVAGGVRRSTSNDPSRGLILTEQMVALGDDSWDGSRGIEFRPRCRWSGRCRESCLPTRGERDLTVMRGALLER
ncbi:hypothetical protein LX36DRAFT_450198 [Colletotrichum falcatum]|nr:hypothetical protein LX36DRAFT_450198 [Colletotrichum falcatum]